jgi:probable HAF family extracellular repeat protein
MKIKYFIACISFVFCAQYGLANGSAYTYSSFAYPGAVDTYVNQINNRGEIIGNYRDNIHKDRAFYCSSAQGGCISIDYPNAIATYATGINDSGYVVGYYKDENGNSHGFWYFREQYVNFDYPNASGTTITAIDNLNAIVVNASGNNYLCQQLGSQCFILPEQPNSQVGYTSFNT